MTALAMTGEAGDRLNRRDFDRLAAYIFEYSGIKMPPAKMTMLEGRLRKRLRAVGSPSFADYCHFLFKEGGLESESVHLINCVTTNKTDFFREPAHFTFLSDVALPTLAAAGHRRLRAWSSACSIGAEPYTLAMVMADFTERTPGTDYTILATDLSSEVLETARAGIYPESHVEPVPPHMVRKYVLQSIDPSRRLVRIAPGLRSHVGFSRFNLMEKSYAPGDAMHLIFCRNVLIYFDKDTQAHVLKQLCECLAPGGYLFIGHSESITGLDLPVKQVANTIFTRM